MQPATFQGINATMGETTMQQSSLKALANKVLERNHQCNSHATKGEKVCNFEPEFTLQKLHDETTQEQHELTVQGNQSQPFNQEAMDTIKAGKAVKVWSGVLQEWLYWVRGEGEREELLAEGCELPIYTLGELVAVTGFSPEDLRNVHELKQGFDATIGEGDDE